MTGMIIGLDTCLCCKLPAAIGMLNGCDEVRSISFMGTDALGRRLGDASCLAMMCRHGTVSMDVLIHLAVLISVLFCLL